MTRAAAPGKDAPAGSPASPLLRSAPAWLFLDDEAAASDQATTLRGRVVGLLLLTLPLTLIAVKTGLSYRSLVWCFGGLALAGAVLAFAGGWLAGRDRIDEADAAHYTGRLLFQLAQVVLSLLLTVPFARWVFSG